MMWKKKVSTKDWKAMLGIGRRGDTFVTLGPVCKQIIKTNIIL